MLTAKLSSKGQIVIPKGVRERLNISSGTFFNIRLENDDIVLTPVKSTPVQRLYGKFAGEKILDELEREHAEEIARENCA
jgi:AbrB family looped-hinge helix DNA binding protein